MTANNWIITRQYGSSQIYNTGSGFIACSKYRNWGEYVRKHFYTAFPLFFGCKLKVCSCNIHDWLNDCFCKRSKPIQCHINCITVHAITVLHQEHDGFKSYLALIYCINRIISCNSWNQFKVNCLSSQNRCT